MGFEVSLLDIGASAPVPRTWPVWSSGSLRRMVGSDSLLTIGVGLIKKATGKGALFSSNYIRDQ